MGTPASFVLCTSFSYAGRTHYGQLIGKTYKKIGAAPATAVAFSGTLNGSQFLTPILVTLSPTDTLSGVAGTPVQIDGGPATNYTVPFLVSNVASHSVQYHSIDVAGDSEPSNSISCAYGPIP